MAEISNNYQVQQYQYQKQQKNSQNGYPQRYGVSVPQRSVRDEFVTQHKKNGLFERLYNGIKNLTHLGTGSKKVEAEIAKAENGEISEEQALATITKYRSSQANSSQIAGDAASIGASMATFFTLNKGIKYLKAGADINEPIMKMLDKIFSIYKNAPASSKDYTEKEIKIMKNSIKISEKVVKTLRSNKGGVAVAAVCAGLLGGLTKKIVGKINRIGSDEYKVDKKDFNNLKTKKDKAAYKAAKKQAKKARHKANHKAFRSGAVNGLMMPIVSVGGGIIGAPLYLIGNTLNRYFIGNANEKNKSMKGFVENFANDGVSNALYSTLLAIPLIKKGRWTSVFNKNIKKVTEGLKDATLEAPELSDKTAYHKIKESLLDSEAIRKIEDNPWLSLDEQIQAVIDENIFAAKFMQDGGTTLGEAIKEHCPPTRTLEQATDYIKEKLGSGYQVRKLLGVGTVAETYLVKGPDGKEVCVKMLKEGINAEKIARDKGKFIDLINGLKDKTEAEKEYLIRNVEDMAEGISKEVDFKNEMEAALRMAKSTQKAGVVKPIMVKAEDGIYVMEKAEGVSLRSFLEMNQLYIKREAIVKSGGDVGYIDKLIEELKSHMPDFDDIKFDKKDVQYVINKYQEAFIEQFHKVDATGKAMHGDPQAANIFINPKALKTRSGHLFTWIDTGNVIDMSAEQAIRSMKLVDFVKQGNMKEIAEFVLDGAKLPSGMSKEQASEQIVKELKKVFFDHSTRIEIPNNENVVAIADSIMEKLQIVPSSSQIGIKRANARAVTSMEKLKESLSKMNLLSACEKETGFGQTVSILGSKAEGKARNKAYEMAISKQEKENYKQLDKKLAKRLRDSEYAPKTNSEEYITYKLKPYKSNLSKEEADDIIKELEDKLKF